MIIEFTKEHPAGIPKGSVKKVDNKLGERMVSEGFAIESTQEAFNKKVEALQEADKQKAIELEKINAKYEKERVKSLTVKTKKDCGCGDKVKEEGEECEECRKKELSAMTKGEITALIEKLELPEEEYKSLNKDLLIDYLISKEK
jgi:hypothetical protein